jgi:hypothetical protein
MTNKNKDNATKELKKILAAELGGKPADWVRLKRTPRGWQDIEREFENKETGETVTATQRTDGLIYAETGDKGREITARIPFNAAATPSTADVVMNMILEDKEVDDGQLAKAIKEGLAKQFSFYVTKYDEGVGEEGEINTFAVIYPTVRDETFKCASIIAPMVPKGDDTDECMVTEWRFKSLDSAAKIASHLESLGMTWDVAYQKERHNDTYKDIVKERGAPKAAPKAKGPQK